MRREYDFDKMMGRRNPYAKRLKKQITIRVGVGALNQGSRVCGADGMLGRTSARAKPPPNRSEDP